MIELYQWARRPFNIIVDILHAEANQLHPDHQTAQSIALDLNTDGLYVTYEVNKKIHEALIANGFTFRCDQCESTYYEHSNYPKCGLTVGPEGDGDEEEEMWVWYFFNHNE